MTRGMPSLAALLGLLAIAGYQNRDKIGELLKGVTSPGGAPDTPGDTSLTGALGKTSAAVAIRLRRYKADWPR